MMVVSSDVVLALDLLRPYEELLKLGLVKRLAAAAISTFISHQWLARSHPDPQGEQLRTLQRFLQKAGHGQIKDLFSERDWSAFKSGVQAKEPHDKLVRERMWRLRELADGFSRYGPNAPDEWCSEELAHSFLWIDYVSVPQALQAHDDGQWRAISSIPYYVAQSSFFVILCPSAQHSCRDELYAYHSWLERGWCRFEMWANILSPQRVVPLVLTDLRAWTIGINDFLYHYGLHRGAVVGCGQFTCCTFSHKRFDGTPVPCDRDSLVSLMESMWCSRVRQASQAGMRWLYGNLKIKETQFFAMSLDAPFHATWGDGSVDDATPKRVLERIETDLLAGRIPDAFSVIGIAAELGDERLLKACVARGDDPNWIDEDGDSVFRLACRSGSFEAVEYLLSLPSMTVEHINLPDVKGRSALRSSVRNQRIVRLLLQSRACPKPCNEGMNPLHVAARLGQDGVVRVLLGMGGISADAVDLRGMTALHHAAEGEGLYGSTAGRIQAIECLLFHGASSTMLNRDGETAYDVALRSSLQAAVDLICAGSQRACEAEASSCIDVLRTRLSR